MITVLSLHFTLKSNRCWIFQLVLVSWTCTSVNVALRTTSARKPHQTSLVAHTWSRLFSLVIECVPVWIVHLVAAAEKGTKIKLRRVWQNVLNHSCWITINHSVKVELSRRILWKPGGRLMKTDGGLSSAHLLLMDIVKDCICWTCRTILSSLLHPRTNLRMFVSHRITLHHLFL